MLIHGSLILESEVESSSIQSGGLDDIFEEGNSLENNNLMIKDPQPSTESSFFLEKSGNLEDTETKSASSSSKSEIFYSTCDSAGDTLEDLLIKPTTGNIDILALACEEVGINVNSNEAFMEVNSDIIDRVDVSKYPVEVKGKAGSNTIFTNECGFESSVSLQFSQNTTKGKGSIISTINAQRKTTPNLLSRRNRFSKDENIISNAVPSRNLPDLSSEKTFCSVVENSENTIRSVFEIKTNPFHDDNPFVYLFKDTRPGQTAFAFYVSDCWYACSESWVLPDDKEFINQCRKWWVNLPTPYRRGYWTREVEYRRKFLPSVAPSKRNPNKCDAMGAKPRVNRISRKKNQFLNTSMNELIIDDNLEVTFNNEVKDMTQEEIDKFALPSIFYVNDSEVKNYANVKSTTSNTFL